MDNIITKVTSNINIENLQLIYIYYISCKDINIKDNYIGKTINFENRKYAHETSSKNSELKIYKKIRDHGGWENWNMEILNTFYCKNEYDARQIEQKYIDYFKTTLNSVKAYSKTFINKELDRQLEFILNNYDDKILGCFTYDYYEINSDEINSDEIFNCEYCEKSFSTKSNLINHQKTAKFCLNKQQKKIIKEYKCFCEKIFTTKIIFERHHKICKISKEENIEKTYLENIENEKKRYLEQLEKKDKNIKELENKIYLQKLENDNKTYLEQLEKKDENIKYIEKTYLEQLEKKDKHIKELEAQLANIAMAGVTKSSITTNNINNKILNISALDLNDDKIKSILDSKFDHNYIIDGQKGVAQFLVDHYLKDEDGKLKYICTDPSRQIFKYKDDLGDIQKDIKAKKLTKTLIDGGLKEKNNKIASSWWTTNDGKKDTDRFTVLQPKAAEISSISISENTLFANELSAITTL